MRIGGYQKLTLVDFPGLIAATVFTQGCNFRCGYCHNPPLVFPELFQEPLSVEMVLDHLRCRQGKLEGVVITGGEPTVQKGLAEFIARVKAMGFAVKLDTNGSHPEILASLLELKLLDYIAMDVKSSKAKYPQITGLDCNIERIEQSIKLIMNSGLPYQFRTTLVKEFCGDEDLDDIQQMIGQANHYVLQPFIKPLNVDIKVNIHDQYSSTEVDQLKARYERVS